MKEQASFQKYRIAAVVPSYHVEGEIANVLCALPAYISQIIVVDDASPDFASEIVAGLAKRDQRIILIRHDHNQGVGGAMVTGFRKRSNWGCKSLSNLMAMGRWMPVICPK